jgi:catechol 2,3-dioxygenase-like lactoylglutathione lyase family enzyme
MTTGRGLHHVEYWVVDLDEARREWGWLLERLGYEPDGAWDDGSTWILGDTYLTFTVSPNTHGANHDRRVPGLNHLAFHGGDSADVDLLVADAPSHGWRPLYHDRYPHAGGERHYAAYLENSAGFKVEIVARPAEGAA